MFSLFFLFQHEDEEDDDTFASPKVQLKATSLLESVGDNRKRRASPVSFETSRTPPETMAARKHQSETHSEEDDVPSTPNVNCKLRTKVALLDASQANHAIDEEISPIQCPPEDNHDATASSKVYSPGYSINEDAIRRTNNKKQKPVNTPGATSVHSSDFELSTGRQAKPFRRSGYQSTYQEEESPFAKTPQASLNLSRVSLNYFDSEQYQNTLADESNTVENEGTGANSGNNNDVDSNCKTPSPPKGFRSGIYPSESEQYQETSGKGMCERVVF